MHNTGRFAGVAASLALVAAACQAMPEPTAPISMQMEDRRDSSTYAPVVRGFYAGGEVLFIHTEASEPQVAEMLTSMMGPEVVLVPRLAEVPASILADVYVFTNGVSGGGPFGFQPDVFDSVPGEAGYSPLRAVTLVTWRDASIPPELRSVEEIQAAAAAGELALEHPGIVVNMPILSWPGGER